MLQQEVGSKRKQTTGRLVSGDQECNDLIADIQIVELLTALFIFSDEHMIEQVLLGAILNAQLFALFNNAINRLVHKVDIGLILAMLVDEKFILKRKAVLLSIASAKARTILCTKGCIFSR